MDARYFKYNTGPATSTLLNGLLGYWKLDETSGSAIDIVNSYNGTIVGGLLLAQGMPGIINTSYVFSGSPQEVTVSTDTTAAALKTQYLTINGWIKTTGSGYKCMASLINGTLTSGFSLTTEATVMRAILGNTTYQITITGTTPINTANWIMVTLTSDGVNGRMYINGIQDGVTTSFPYPLAYSTSNDATFRIGSRGFSPTSYFVGGIDEIAIWNRALTNAEILYGLYFNGSGRTHPFI